MTDGWFGLLDMAIVGVPALIFGIWQIVSIRREIAKGKKPPDALPDRPRHSVGEHRLDDR